MNYDEHYPKKGYRKVWPERPWCPLCGLNNIVRACVPLYVPKLGTPGGEKVVVYVCGSCYKLYKSIDVMTVEEFKEYHKCHLERVTHLNTLK